MEEEGERANRLEPLSFHKCQLCAFRTNSVYALLCHRENHQLKSDLGRFSCKSAELEVYECKFCYFESDLKIAAYKHESLVHGTKRCSDPEIKLRSYICDKCSFETYSVIVFARHFCDDCQLEESMTTTHPEIWSHCGKCSYKTKYKGDLKRHCLRKHSNLIASKVNWFESTQCYCYAMHSKPKKVKWFECEQCSHKTKEKAHLKMHVLLKHSSWKPNDIKWFKCAQCSHKTKTKSNLNSHMLLKHTKHDEIKWFECEQCSHKTKMRSDLNKHILRKHSKLNNETKWFECEQCSHKSKTKGNLKMHIIVKHTKHDEIKWFECEQCSHKTKTKGDLKKHISRQHPKLNEIKWFECAQCSYKTKRKDHLKTHISAKHSSWKPIDIKWFECKECSHKTKTKSNLKKHILKKHSKSC